MPKITVYSKDGCPGCVAIKTVLSARGFIYEEINVSKNPDSMQYIIDKKFASFPVIEIEGKEPMTGSIPQILDYLTKK